MEKMHKFMLACYKLRTQSTNLGEPLCNNCLEACLLSFYHFNFFRINRYCEDILKSVAKLRAIYDKDQVDTAASQPNAKTNGKLLAISVV